MKPSVWTTPEATPNAVARATTVSFARATSRPTSTAIGTASRLDSEKA